MAISRLGFARPWVGPETGVDWGSSMPQKWEGNKCSEVGLSGFKSLPCWLAGGGLSHLPNRADRDIVHIQQGSIPMQ